MKNSIILVIFALSVIVKGAWLAAAVRGIEPIIFSFGAAFVALSSDVNLDNYKYEFFWRKKKKWDHSQPIWRDPNEGKPVNINDPRTGLPTVWDVMADIKACIKGEFPKNRDERDQGIATEEEIRK